MIKKLFVFTFFTVFLQSYGFDKNALTYTSLSPKSPGIQDKHLTPSFQKALFFHVHAKTAQKNAKSFLTMNTVKNIMGTMIRYNKIEDFIAEDDILTHAKQEFIIKANKNDYIIPISHFDAMLLNYQNDPLALFDRISGIKVKYSIKDALNLTYKTYLPLLNTLKIKENETTKQGNHTFYHALKEDIYASMYINTKIIETIYKIPMDNFLMLRIPTTKYSPTEDGAALREFFLEFGSKNDHMPKDQYHLLSANHTIVGSMKFSYDSSLNLLCINDNVDQGAIFPIQPLFELYHVADIYKTFKDDFEALAINSNSGVLLEIITDDNITAKASYLAWPFGAKVDDEPYQAGTLANKKLVTNSPGLLSLKNHKAFLTWQKSWWSFLPFTAPHYIRPLSQLQWHLILTDDLLLSPSNPETREGFKIKAYALNQRALDHFHQNVDALFEKIKQYYEEQNKVPYRV